VPPGGSKESAYRAFASSSAKALCGPRSLERFMPPFFFARRGRSNPPLPGPPAPPLVPCAGPLGCPPLGCPPAPAAGPPACPPACPLDFGGCAGLARSSRSSRGALSNRRMIECISSALGASMNAKPLDSCVSGLRMTLIASATRFSAVSQPLMSSAVTQAGRLPRKTVKLIRWLSSTP